MLTACFCPSSGVQHCTHSNRYMSYRLCWLLASVHHQESSTVHTAIGICHTGYSDCLLGGSGCPPPHHPAISKLWYLDPRTHTTENCLFFGNICFLPNKVQVCTSVIVGHAAVWLALPRCPFSARLINPFLPTSSLQGKRRSLSLSLVHPNFTRSQSWKAQRPFWTIFINALLVYR